MCSRAECIHFIGVFLCRIEMIVACVRGSSALTFGSEDHLSVYCSGDDGLGEVLQVPAQTVTQDGKLHLIQVC